MNITLLMTHQVDTKFRQYEPNVDPFINFWEKLKFSVFKYQKISVTDHVYEWKILSSLEHEQAKKKNVKLLKDKKFTIAKRYKFYIRVQLFNESTPEIER